MFSKIIALSAVSLIIFFVSCAESKTKLATVKEMNNEISCTLKDSGAEIEIRDAGGYKVKTGMVVEVEQFEAVHHRYWRIVRVVQNKP